jgi:hypothetical protein
VQKAIDNLEVKAWLPIIFVDDTPKNLVPAGGPLWLHYNVLAVAAGRLIDLLNTNRV